MAGSRIDARRVLEEFYPEDTPLRRLLLEHSRSVREEALAIAESPACRGMGLDLELVSSGAWLHDVGVGRCHAPSILCTGDEPYLRHGIVGGEMLRAYGAEHGLDMEPYARICERHTGSGLAAAEIRERGLPLPVQDFLPVTPEEKLVCLADKFHSKSGDGRRKPLAEVRRGMARFGAGPVARLEALLELFGLGTE